MSDSTEASRELRSLNADEAERVLTEWGHKSYRATQLLGWLYKKRASSIDEMSDLPLELRDQLSEAFSLQPLELTREQCSRDGTVKFLWRLADGELIESVLIPASIGRDGSQSGRRTLCVSSQVGCAYGCTFCASGLMGYRRNLDASEIVDQVLAVERWHLARGAESPKPEPMVNNIVMMGMGEPLYNFDNVIKALKIVLDPEGIGISKRRITLSTAGVVPMIERVGAELGVALAISFHAVRDDVRDQLVPLNRKYPIAEMLAACRAYPAARNARRITFEYVMLNGINDSPADARELVRLIAGIPAKVNLIPFNAWPGAPYECSGDEAIRAFAGIVNRAGYSSPVRTPRGRDIFAACGQLKSASVRERAPARAPDLTVRELD